MDQQKYFLPLSASICVNPRLKKPFPVDVSPGFQRRKAVAEQVVTLLEGVHHGKVRLGLHAAPQDQDYPDRGDDRGLPIRGVRDGDELPAVVLTPDEPPVPKVTLSLSPAAMGLSCQTGVSWRERCIGLMQRHSPTTLALLEAILRAADVQASQLNTNDPTLSTEACA